MVVNFVNFYQLPQNFLSEEWYNITNGFTKEDKKNITGNTGKKFLFPGPGGINMLV